jgi:hypothetical protein
MFSKHAQISNFMKILPVGAELFQSDERTDMTRLIAAFRYISNGHKNWRSMGTFLKAKANNIV